MLGLLAERLAAGPAVTVRPGAFAAPLRELLGWCDTPTPEAVSRLLRRLGFRPGRRDREGRRYDITIAQLQGGRPATPPTQPSHRHRHQATMRNVALSDGVTVRREDWRRAGSNPRQSGTEPRGASSFKDAVVVIPKGLVPRGAEEATVRVAGPNGSEPRPIRIGLGDDQHVEVTVGLKAGGRVVLSGRPR